MQGKIRYVAKCYSQAAARVHTVPLDIFFFFSSRRRHTRSDRDWSSDVCSSDLQPRAKSPCASVPSPQVRGSAPTPPGLFGCGELLDTFHLSPFPHLRTSGSP